MALKDFIKYQLPEQGDVSIAMGLTFGEISVDECNPDYYEPFTVTLEYYPNGIYGTVYPFEVELSLPEIVFGYYESAIDQVDEAKFISPSHKSVLLNKLSHAKDDFSNGHPGKSWHLMENQILNHLDDSADAWIIDDFDRINLRSIILKYKHIFDALSCVGW